MNAEIHNRRWWNGAAALVLVAVALGLVPNRATAQQQRLTAKQLLADSVSDIGPKHAPVDEGIVRFINGDQAGAYTLFKSAKTAAKEIPPAEVLMAKLWIIAGGQSEQAARVSEQATRNWLEKAVAVDPLDPEAYSFLAESALGSGRTTDAEMLFAKSLDLAEKFTGNAKRKLSFQRRGLKGLAMVAQRRQAWPEAKGFLDRWVKIDAESGVAHALVANVLFYLEKPAEAYKEFQESDRLVALAADKREKAPSPMAELNMAQLYQRRDNDDKKTTDLIALAVKNHPKDFGVRLKAAFVAMQSNLLDVALTHSDAAVKMDETSLDAKILRGYVARLRNDFKTAEHFFELAHLQSPGNFDAANNLALLLAEQKDEAKQTRGFEFAAMNVQRFPINGQAPARFDAVSTYGWVQYQRKQFQEAEQALQQVINANGLTPDAKYYVARLLNDKDRAEDAIKVLSEAVEAEAPFVNRKAAEELLATLKKKAGGAGATGATTPGTATPGTKAPAKTNAAGSK